ncbi:MAG: sialate O-acetylesterase, partial [Gemmataceae bacterium]|nr:sialate O-acetylesterase [Gemmataceae bacterium]
MVRTLLGIACAALLLGRAGSADAPEDGFADARALVGKYCLSCHSAKAKKGSLDLERFVSSADVRKDLKVPNLPVVIGELTGPWVDA